MKFHFSIAYADNCPNHQEITMITDSNYSDYLHALNIIKHVVHAEIAKNEAILQQQHKSFMEETADTYCEEDNL